ncbi:flagellar biosynthetic protein FliR [Seohaeicola zhoushanensis]|uniref:Flagellar biosynthetic protein FliR n=1 Tax=Seohaeicola zhoushanensis TaxID=1569283 RepID=A0A8J3GU71_9RHOB|nr:flagellar biosynthetic protein FliR [Seohaeicola zhoushanensis]GHF36049.1 flagellar biosynthetic protein FliR [Seohaeicola zhoushanensis]
MDLTALLTSQVLGYALVFARLGSVMVFMPGIGEQMIPIRHRLAMGVVLSLALYPATPVGPLQFDTPLDLFPLLVVETAIGIWIGVTARILLSGLQLAGYQVGIVTGLSNAFAPSIGSFEGSTLLATALMLTGVTLIFVTDLHHGIIEALVMSYDIFPPGRIMAGDMAEQTVRAVSHSFYIGTMISAPFFVMGLVLNVGFGLANRMMPTLPVFFVAAPLLIAAGMFVLVVAAPAMMHAWLEDFSRWVGLLAF